MQAFTESYQVLYQEVIDVNKDINDKCAELANTFYGLSKTFMQISELNKMIKVNKQHDLFGKIAKMMTATGNNFANTGELIKLYCGSHLKYHLQEYESMSEILQAREQLKDQYIKKERHLFDRKEKLFRGKDVSRWGFTQGKQEELVSRSEELFNNKNKAFKYMLSDDTIALNQLREELSFYTN